MKKIAFLFLVYDQIEQESTWFEFFKYIDPQKYSIHIHCKSFKAFKYFEEFRYANPIITEYMDISIVYAHNLLIEVAIADTNVWKTVNLSQSCIPLKSFDYTYDILTRNDHSHFNDCGSNHLFPRCDPALPFFDDTRSRISKSSNWFILSRQHAQLCLNRTEYVEAFAEVVCPEEHVHITTVRNEDTSGKVTYTNNLAHGATTFTNWPDMHYKYRTDKGLKTYDSISAEELEYLWNAPCLFGRKFTANCTVGDDAVPLVDYMRPRLSEGAYFAPAFQRSA